MLHYATSSHILLRLRFLDVSVAVVSFVVVVSFLACFCTSPHTYAFRIYVTNVTSFFIFMKKHISTTMNNAFIFTKTNIGNATYK